MRNIEQYRVEGVSFPPSLLTGEEEEAVGSGVAALKSCTEQYRVVSRNIEHYRVVSRSTEQYRVVSSAVE